MVSFLITNGGPHPADKWADLTTKTILDLIQIADDADTPEAAVARQAKRELSPVLFKIFMEGCQCVQNEERSALSKEGCKRLHKKLAPHSHADEAMEKVHDALEFTPFGEHFRKPEVEAVIKQIIGQHYANAQHVERSWHADRNPDNADAKAFRARHNG